MASPVIITRNYKFNVFPSFHGPDVRGGFLSHLRKQFQLKRITMFNDQGIEKSEMIAPSLIQAIRESRISIVILSKKYASSSWCLYELVEILECKRAMGQIVMTIFYGVDPSEVRNQTGDFGRAFNETCASKTDEESQRWRRALTYVSNIPGEHSLNWEDEAEMIEKISRDVLYKLNATLSTDFDDMVGLEAHLREIESLLDLNYEGVKMVGITGPAGIGKTTIARALYSRLSNRFQLSCFVGYLGESFHSGLDEYGLKLLLQKQLLSRILNQYDVRVCHLGAITERLCDIEVLIILNDVNDIKQLEALAHDTTWFGPGSRIVVTTKNREILQQHGINNTYHLGFPSREEALEILCRSAFRKSSPPNGFEKLADRVTEICGNLPLALRVVGSSLRGETIGYCELVINRLETNLDPRIEDVLRFSYESLNKNEQSLFLHIAVFFNYSHCDLVKTMLVGSNVDVKRGLKILVNKSLIDISINGETIVMHRLLQQMGTIVIHNEEPWKRRILIDALDICDVLENDKGTRAVSGISFDIYNLHELSISVKAFKKMPDLRFLRVYKSKEDGSDVLHIPDEIEFPRRLRLLHWEAYPNKCLPLTFHPGYLVELKMQKSQLKILWEGTKLLTNLKKMDLSYSRKLKEFPDLSNAPNLEILELSYCESLKELPSSIANLHKLKELCMQSCTKLEFVPTHINLASLEKIDMAGCSRLRVFPDISKNVSQLFLSDTAIEEVPKLISQLSRLWYVDLSGSINLKTLTYLPKSVVWLNLSNSGVERITHGIRGLHSLEELNLSSCRNLESLPELPSSITLLTAEDCESLESVSSAINTSNAQLNFTNCFKLSGEARRRIIQRPFLDGITCIPGKVIPSEFNHRARGNSLTIGPFSAFSSLEACVMISPDQHQYTREEIYTGLRYRIIGRSGDAIYINPVSVLQSGESPKILTNHLCIFHCDLPREEICFEVGIEIFFELSNSACGPLDDCEIIECGVRILTNESERNCDGSDGSGLGQDSDWSFEFEPSKMEDSEDEFVTSECLKIPNCLKIVTKVQRWTNQRTHHGFLKPRLFS